MTFWIRPLRLTAWLVGDNAVIPGSTLFWGLNKSVVSLDATLWNAFVKLFKGGVATYMYQANVIPTIHKTSAKFNSASFLPSNSHSYINENYQEYRKKRQGIMGDCESSAKHYNKNSSSP